MLDDLLEIGAIELPKPKRTEEAREPPTPNTIDTTGSLVTLLKSALHSRSASCDWLEKEELF